MLTSVTLLEQIRLDPPMAQIYSRLGYKKKRTSLTPQQRLETDRYIEEAVSLIGLKGSFLQTPIRRNDGQTIEMDGGIMLPSAKLAAFLQNCREAVLMAATAGSAIMDAIREKIRQENMTAAVVYDATASEMTDAALDWTMAYINRPLLRRGARLLPGRFSAGYGDFALTNQKILYETLQLEKIGITLNPSFLLVPEKSVTAIGGIDCFV